MRYGIQRRGVYILPPTEAETAWISGHLEEEEIWRAFGYASPAGADFWARRKEIEAAVIRRAETRERVGFVLVFPPTASFPMPEVAYAIPRRRHRDAFTALAAADALSHYLFDHVGVERIGWRTRASNLAAQAVLRRLGYESAGEARLGGNAYVLHRLENARWATRRRLLERRERMHPSGIGGAFVILRGPPFTPLVPSR